MSKLLLIIIVSALSANTISATNSTDYGDEEGGGNTENENKCSGQHEEYVVCPPDCPIGQCGIDDRAVFCRKSPKVGDPECSSPACRCKKGFYRIANGGCVTWDQCPTCNKTNEVYDECPASCPPRRCGVDNRAISCMAPPKPGDPACRPGCRCADGYVKNDNGDCVTRSQCPPVCKKNEVPSNCTNGGCQAKNCSQLGKPIPCVKLDPAACKKGCLCKDGYLRADNGTCIPEEKCPVCTGDNEEWNSCPITCPPQTCGSINGTYHCPLIRPTIRICKGSCRCKPGYYRNTVEQCISKAECSICTGQNEEWNPCPPTCSPQTCDSINKTYNCPLEPQVCNGSCRCKSGYYRNTEGQCISEEECSTCKGQNEEWNSCPSACPPQTCESINKTYNCPLESLTCNGTCRCKAGFFRNKINQCISEKECLKCTGPNEYFSCGGACDNVCATLDKQNQTNCPIRNIVCNKKCYCEEGYARNASNICIPIENCTQCPDGELYTKCPPTKCDREYCPLNNGDPQYCPTPKECGLPRCICGFNRHRDRNTGKCIPTTECPPFKCDGPNEVYDSCPPVCPGEKCSDYINNSTCSSRFRIGIVVPCKPACRCKPNYYRNNEGTCIKNSDCYGDTTNTTTTVTPSTTCSDSSEALNRLELGNSAFTGKFLYQVLKNSLSSTILSPFSVLIPLAQLALYAKDGSYTELINALNLKDNDEIRCVFPTLTKRLESQQDVEFALAAKVFSNINYQLSDNFLRDTKDIFDAQAQALNFSNTAQAADIINAWVANQTNNRITDLVSPDLLSTLTRLVLTNAIYFKGNWVSQFNPNNTKNRDFYVNNNKTIQVKTMYQKGSFKYAELPSLDAKAIQLPYKGGNFSFVVILPNEIQDGLVNLANKLQDPAVYNDVLNNLTTVTCQVYLPSIEVTTSRDLSDILKKLGITKIFNASTANLEGILTKPEELYVSAAIQKAFLVVNEVGSEAAAANAIVVTATSAVLPPPKVYIFKADRPFIFYINIGQMPLFTGVFTGA